LGLNIVRFFSKKTVAQGVVGLSLSRQGIAIAVADYSQNQATVLSHCEFIAASKTLSPQQQLSECVKRLQLSRYECFLVLNSDLYRRVNIEKPAVADSEMIQAIRWKINELVDFKVDDALLDYYQAPPLVRASQGDMLDVVAGSHEVIQEPVNVCLQAGLIPKVIDIQETALRNLAIHLPANAYGVALLYLSASAGMIIIVKDGTIYLARRLEIGYRKLGVDAASFDNVGVTNAARKNLALELQRSLDYVESYYGIPAITEIAVMPIEGDSEPLLQSLRDNYGINSSVVDIASLLGHNETDKAQQCLCALAIGVSLRDASLSQQIDLYKHITQTSQHSPQLWRFVGLSVFFLLLFASGNGYLLWQSKQLEQQVQQQRAVVAQETARLTALLASLPKQEVDAALVKDVASWQQKLQELTQTVDLLTSKDSIAAQGFSRYFQALANRSVADIWFTHLYFDGTQQHIQLEGSTFKPQQIAYFLQQLQAESVFHGQSFATLMMDSSKENAKQLNFTLSSTLEPITRKDEHAD
jgi:MSHA biogenesis protein MshI